MRRRWPTFGPLRGAVVAGAGQGGRVQEMMAAIRFRAFDDAAPALEELRGRGLRLVCVSNWDYALPEVLERVGLLGLLDGVVTSAGVGRPSPTRRSSALRSRWPAATPRRRSTWGQQRGGHRRGVGGRHPRRCSARPLGRRRHLLAGRTRGVLTIPPLTPPDESSLGPLQGPPRHPGAARRRRARGRARRCLRPGAQVGRREARTPGDARGDAHRRRLLRGRATAGPRRPRRSACAGRGTERRGRADGAHRLRRLLRVRRSPTRTSSTRTRRT